MRLRHALAPEEIRVMTRGDGSRVVAGYASVYGNKNRHGEIFRRGAFAATIANAEERARVVHLLHHDMRTALGMPVVLEEKKRGLYFETAPLPTPTADAGMIEIEAGALRGVSIGFNPRSAETYVWVEKKSGGHIEVTDAELLEISSVRWGSDTKALAAVEQRADALHPERVDRARQVGIDLHDLLSARYHPLATEHERRAIDALIDALHTGRDTAERGEFGALVIQKLRSNLIRNDSDADKIYAAISAATSAARRNNLHGETR
jgi:HK97 family phage prohead protease